MWTVAISTLAVLSALGWTINAALFVPYRVKPIYRFLYKRSAWYRSWYYRQALKRLTVATKKVERAIGEKLVPAFEKTAQAMREWAEAYGD